MTCKTASAGLRHTATTRGDGRRRGSDELAQSTHLGTDRQVAAYAGTCEDLSVFRLHSRAHIGHPEPLGKHLRVQSFGGPGDQISIGQPLVVAGSTCILRLGQAASLPRLRRHRVRVCLDAYEWAGTDDEVVNLSRP